MIKKFMTDKCSRRILFPFIGVRKRNHEESYEWCERKCLYKDTSSFLDINDPFTSIEIRTVDILILDTKFIMML